MKFEKVAIFVILNFLIFNSCAFSQIVINMTNSDSKKNLNDIQFSQVINNSSKTISLGKLKNNYNNQDLVIGENIESGIFKFLKTKYISEKSSKPILVEINDTYIDEKNYENGSVVGLIYLQISFYTINSKENKLICKANSQIKYTRNSVVKDPKTFENNYKKLIENCVNYLTNYLEKNKNLLEDFATKSKVIVRPFYQENHSDTIYYNTKTLTWDDFRAKPNPHSKYGATIYTSIAIDTKIGVSNSTILAEITPKVYMVPKMSWVISDGKTNAALKHEQTHFDITRIVMNRLIKKFEQLEANSMDDLQSMIKYEYLEGFKEMNRLQTAYDFETSHSLNKQKQLEWEQKVKEWLQNPSFSNE